jgi:hypothetical protein
VGKGIKFNWLEQEAPLRPGDAAFRVSDLRRALSLLEHSALAGDGFDLRMEPGVTDQLILV